ncbi:hypothetical protein [Micromonospora halophytica]|uniref:Uncharacterized protein n=1 Tax=Micromonospora halophytica TaxID=47864 RepID=A0A1C5HHY7_9ACTN|nr:hypothetical protein [Micromonospora halophytica]SCG45610.1 hypothetical protein GA0070560_104222 [Micromonospora halophytica]
MPPRPAPRSWLARRLRDAADAAERWAAGSGPADADPPVDVPPRRPGQPPEHWLRLVAEHAPGLLRDLDLPPDTAGRPAGPAPSGVRGQPTATGHAPEPHPTAGRLAPAAHRPGTGLAATAAPRRHDHRPDRSGPPGGTPVAAPRAGVDPAGVPTVAGDQTLRRVVASGRTTASGDGEDRGDLASEAWPGSASSTGSGGGGHAPAGIPARLRPAVPPPGWLPPVAGSAPDRPARPDTGRDAGAASHALPLLPARPAPVDAVAPGLPGGPHDAAPTHPLGSRPEGPDTVPSEERRGSHAPHGSAGGVGSSGGVRFTERPAPGHPGGAGTGHPALSPAAPADAGYLPSPPLGHLRGRATGSEPFPFPPGGPGGSPFPGSGPGRAAGEGREAERENPPGGEARLPCAAGPDGVPPVPDGLRVGAARVAWRPEADPLPAGTVPPAGRSGPARPPHGGQHADDAPDRRWAYPGDPWPALPDEPPGPGRDAVVVPPAGTTTTARWWGDDPWPALPDDRDRRPAADADPGGARWNRLDREQRGA